MANVALDKDAAGQVLRADWSGTAKQNKINPMRFESEIDPGR